jgi:hypothetical protein
VFKWIDILFCGINEVVEMVRERKRIEEDKRNAELERKREEYRILVESRKAALKAARDAAMQADNKVAYIKRWRG